MKKLHRNQHPDFWEYPCATRRVLHRWIFPPSPLLCLKTHLLPTMFLPADKSTKSQILFCFSEMCSLWIVSRHSLELTPFKASSMVAGSSVSMIANNAASIRFHQSSVKTFSLSGGLLARWGLPASSSIATFRYSKLPFSGVLLLHSASSFSAFYTELVNNSKFSCVQSNFSTLNLSSMNIKSRLRRICFVCGLQNLNQLSFGVYWVSIFMEDTESTFCRTCPYV